LREPSSYPVCKVAGHIHDNSATTTFAPTILNDNATPVPSISSPDAPPLSVPSSLRSIESLAGVLPLDNLHLVPQQSVESLHASSTSPDAAIAGTIRDIITSGTSMSQSTLEPSISSPPLSPTSSPAAFSLRQNTEPLMPSVPPNHSSPASSNQVLSVLPTESRHPIVATAAPSASPRLTSAPDLGAAADDDGSRKPGLRKDKDAVDPPSVNRAIHGNTMSTPYPPPESPSQPSVTDSDLVITGRSPRGPLAIAERTGDHPPHPSQPDHRIHIPAGSSIPPYSYYPILSPSPVTNGTRLMAQSILRFLAAFVFATQPMTSNRPPRSSSLSPISTRFLTNLGREFGGEKLGVHDVNESETIGAVELGRSPQHTEGRSVKIGSSSVARAFVSGESTGHGFDSVTRAFLGETFGMHHGQCPRLDILKYDETSLLRKMIKIETLDHPGPKATVKSIRRKVHSHFPDLGLPNEMYPANWVICVLRKARRSTHYSSGCDSGGCDSDTDTTKPNNIASTSLTSTSSTTATRLVQLSDPITL
ncbi:hypothetical protein EDB84DRAFT_1609050, partial [Lactarius hengduanensis]